MDIILIPGLWLDGSSWEQVLPVLERAGHRTHPLTLPGMESKDADRSKVTLRDQLDAVVDAIDAAAGKVVLVGHSLGCGIAYAALDARPDRVARAVYIGGFPSAAGAPLAQGFTVVDGEIPMPDWSELDDADLVGLDEQLRAQFRQRAIPAPGRLASDPQQLSDERRYDVPVTVICPEFTSQTLRKWIEQDLEPVRELIRIRQVEYVDLPTGHWPQFTRPEDLGRAILQVQPLAGDAGTAEPAATGAGTAEPVSPRRFQEADGVEDWRVVFAGACTAFRTGSFAKGVTLVEAIGRLADAAGHRPDVDLRPAGVIVRLRSDQLGSLSERDLELARRISAAARELGVPAEPGAVQTVQIAIDALVGAEVLPFWRAVLGYDQVGDEDLVDPHGSGPSIWFQEMGTPRPQRNRIHVDISVPHDQAEARVAAALAAGGRLVSDQHAPAWWTLADPEGNEVDVATWMGRE